MPVFKNFLVAASTERHYEKPILSGHRHNYSECDRRSQKLHGGGIYKSNARKKVERQTIESQSRFVFRFGITGSRIVITGRTCSDGGCKSFAVGKNWTTG